MGGQSVEALLPCDSTREYPVFDRPEPRGVETTPAHATPLLPHHQPRACENLEVLVDGGERHRQWRRKIGYARRSTGQPVEDRPPSWVRQGSECGVELGRLMIKHILK